MGYDWSNAAIKPQTTQPQPALNSIGSNTANRASQVSGQNQSIGNTGASFKGTPSFGSAQPQQPAYKQTQAPSGMDQTMPGVAEQYWNNNQNLWQQSPQLDWANQQLPQFANPTFGETYNQNNIGAFGAPGQGEQFWNQVQGNFNTAGKYQSPGYSSQAFDSTVKNQPGSLQSDFDSYWNRATDKATGDANSQAAARGVYGSSAALNNVGNVATDMGVQKANAQNQFNLQNSQNQLAWQNAMNGQANSAENASQGAFNTNLGGMNAFGGLAFNAQNADLAGNTLASNAAFGVSNQQQNRLNNGIGAATTLDSSALNRTNSGFNAANQAQNQFTGRAQGDFNNQMSYLNAMMPFLTGQYGGLSSSDQQAMEDYWNSQLGQTQNASNTATSNRNQATDDIYRGVSAVTGAMQAGK